MTHDPKAILAQAQIAVDALVKQYHQDLALIAQINDVQSQRMATAARISKEQNIPLRNVLANQSLYSAFATLATKEEGLKAEQQLLWDSMFYANPVIWIMYKYQAYQGGNNEISTVYDLKRHCEPRDYIGTKRFHFLNTYLISQQKAPLTDTALYPDDMRLPLLYESESMTGLVNDTAFMKLWSEHEFYKRKGKVAKWKNYTIHP